MMETNYSGRCLCGAIRYDVASEVRSLCYCHCESCRRAAGAAFVAWGTVSRSAFRVTQGELAVYRSSPQVERGFCARCGTTLTYSHEGRADDIDFTLATLDQPRDLAPQSHIWLQDKPAWVSIGDGLPQYPTWKNAGAG